MPTTLSLFALVQKSSFFAFIFRVWLYRFISCGELRTFSSIKRSAVIRISSRYIMKGGPYVRHVEAQTMAFVRSHTSIPVPFPHKTLLDTQGNVYIIMEFIDAPELDWSILTEDEQNYVLEQLGRYLDELRTIKPPAGTHIEALDKGPLLDPRRGSTPFGPFKSFESFAQYFGYGVLSDCEEPSVKESLARFFARQHGLVFTHGDLAPRNILVRDGTIIAILDWECAGWYPEYWEVTRALHSNLDMPDFGDKFRGLFSGKFDDEIGLEYELASRLFG